MKIVDGSVVIVAPVPGVPGKRYVRLNKDDESEADPNKATGFVLHPDDRRVR